MTERTLAQRLWALCCSLKLAIVLATMATAVAIVGSLAIHFHPAIFGDLDRRILGEWLRLQGPAAPLQAGWLVALAVLMLLLALNTLCCVLDWLRHLAKRWQKTGEYLIHAGFVMIVLAFFWGSLAGSRHSGLALAAGDATPVPGRPGIYLRLEGFEPVLGADGRPSDLRSTIVLLRGDRALARTILRLNHPLIWQDLVILPESVRRFPTGFAAVLNGNEVTLEPGAALPVRGKGLFEVIDFYPDMRIGPGGEFEGRRDRLGNPAFLLDWTSSAGDHWRGWYFPRRGLPARLARLGLRLQLQRPLFETAPVVTVNSDPGARLALIGAAAMFLGILLALASFYRKRARGDRPNASWASAYSER
jgi:cytochrome c biogenesis protein